MRTEIKEEDLRRAKELGHWTLDNDSQFRLRRHYDTDSLHPPNLILKAGTVVHVVKVYRRGQAALLSHIDANGTVWWSWTHAGRMISDRPPMPANVIQLRRANVA